MEESDDYSSSVHIRGLEGDLGSLRSLFERVSRHIFREHGVDKYVLSITFVGDEDMTRLNRNSLGREGSTDVISFDLSEEGLPYEKVGDIYISVDRARENSRRFDVSHSEELLRLVVHGTLHLLGYDQYKLGHSYDHDTPLHPGDPLHVVLYWQAQSRPQTDWQLAMQLAPVANPDSPITEGVFPAAGVDYPTSHWGTGEVVRGQFDLFLPGDALPGKYRVNLSLLNEAGTSATETFTLAPISVE